MESQGEKNSPQEKTQTLEINPSKPPNCHKVLEKKEVQELMSQASGPVTYPNESSSTDDSLCKEINKKAKMVRNWLEPVEGLNIVKLSSMKNEYSHKVSGSIGEYKIREERTSYSQDYIQNSLINRYFGKMSVINEETMNNCPTITDNDRIEELLTVDANKKSNTDAPLASGDSKCENIEKHDAELAALEHKSARSRTRKLLREALKLSIYKKNIQDNILQKINQANQVLQSFPTPVVDETSSCQEEQIDGWTSVKQTKKVSKISFASSSSLPSEHNSEMPKSRIVRKRSLTPKVLKHSKEYKTTQRDLFEASK